MQQWRAGTARIIISYNSSLYLQARYDVASHQVVFNDLINIVAVFIGVPNRLRVNDTNRTLRTSVQATGAIYPNFPSAGEPEFLAALLGIVPQCHGIMIHTTLAPFLPLVGAEKNMPLIMAVCRQNAYSREIAVNVSFFSLPTGTSELFLIV